MNTLSCVVSPPLGLLAELTHRCPLQCPYCSNPLVLDAASAELDTDGWKRVLSQAADLGVLQVHFSGGEPMSRRDLEVLVRHATQAQLYTNLITSGVTLTEARLAGLVAAGLEHIQLSFQDVETANAERIGGLKGAQSRKLRAARLIREADVALTINFVVHRQNVAQVGQMVDLAVEIGARRVEIAHTQYYGWGLLNRASLLPDLGDLHVATSDVEAARERHAGRIAIDYITPDYHAYRPKACMGGWARRFINISPAGRALPCHAAETIQTLDYPSVRDMSLEDIWLRSEAFNRFRGTDWMPTLCQGCALKERDWGGCRCQALALTGDASATDPVCELSTHHHLLRAVLQEHPRIPPPFAYRASPRR
jgi:pyrroloquinoline quinone biosynthesis protein E